MYDSIFIHTFLDENARQSFLNGEDGSSSKTQTFMLKTAYGRNICDDDLQKIMPHLLLLEALCVIEVCQTNDDMEFLSGSDYWTKEDLFEKFNQ